MVWHLLIDQILLFHTYSWLCRILGWLFFICAFFYGSITYLLLYVDGVIVTESSSLYIDSLVDEFWLHFDMNDLDALKYFLGLEISWSIFWISIYSWCLPRFGMLSLPKPCNTPTGLMSPGGDASPCSESEAQSLRAIVGALHYLTFTRRVK